MNATMSSSRSRLVVGCGYLGMRVARRWRAAGSRVVAVTRRPDRAASFAAEGLEPLLADVADPDVDWSAVADLEDLATVFWAVGFDRGGGGTHHDVHVTGLRRLLDALPAGCRMIFSSSTGVWGDEAGRIVDESTPPNPAREAGRALVAAETLLRGHPRGPGVALRFAGLYGPGRLPRIADVQAGRPLDADPDSWLNMIHVDDAARVVVGVAELAAPRPLYVVSDGRPVLRRDWYGRLAAAVGGPPPRFLPDHDTAAASRGRGADKRVDPTAMLTDLAPLLGDRVLDHPDSLAAITGPRGSGTP